MSPLYTVFRTHDIDNLYLEFYFKTTKWHRFMKLNGDSGARFDRFTISSTQFMEMPIPYPTLEEQQKIGEYFDSFDNLITLHQRISLYFFKINTFVWEQRKLSELATMHARIGWQNLRTSEFLDAGDYMLITGTDFEDGKVNYSTCHYVEKERYDQDKNIQIKNGNILITKDGTLGKVAYVEGLSLPATLNAGVFNVEVKDENETDSKYLFQFLKAPFLMDYVSKKATGGTIKHLNQNILVDFPIATPSKAEQVRIGEYFSNLDNLITLHQRKPYFWNKFIVIDWEQRKFGEITELKSASRVHKDEWTSNGVPFYRSSDVMAAINGTENEKAYISEELYEKLSKVSGKLEEGDILVTGGGSVGNPYIVPDNKPLYTKDADLLWIKNKGKFHPYFLYEFFFSPTFRNYLGSISHVGTIAHYTITQLSDTPICLPSFEEQKEVGEYFQSLDNLITLHHHKLFVINGTKLFTVIQCKYYSLLNILIKNKNTKEAKLMPELERIIEEKLIEQLVYGDSQWTYREDLKTEEDLWRNFKYILEQNNKDRLNGESLSDAEFEQVKNQLQFSSFYKAGEWLVGENGKVMVHVQRDTEKLHLVVMNHEHIAGGSSVYEVINQYSALKDEDDYYTVSRNRRFDVTLMINGLPMIHIELKNRQHSYMDGFNQIKKYISEGKFTGIFSAVQMFVVSNGVDTKYFAAASDTDLNAKFMSGWVDEKNNPVSDYLDFAKSVLRIPEAHEMIARYTVLDRDAKRLIILRPYQIHAIESIREASKIGKSGFVWHTTGSGKTLTSYKATRNLLMDIPSLDKTIFLIDRKDLDTQTSSAFQAYANNDVIAVDKTDNVNDLKKKLKSGDRKVIVTTIQKMQILVTKRLQEDTPEYNKIKNLRIAFVVDECHRAVTPKTKRELERFFGRSLWFGFTGTPRFAENPYAQMGDLPRTTEELYGKCLHKYTIQNAIKDNAVLGFQVEHNGPKNMEDETDPSLYDNETHMLRVLDIILNKSYQKFGLQNGKGQTYEAILTTSSIQLAQKYYELLSKVKNGETDLEIDERMRQVLPDYPKFAITYSVTENEEGSHVNQEKMQKSLND